MKTVTKAFVLSVVGAGAVALASTAASASIACSGNVCWHVHQAYHYPRGTDVVIHPDNWRRGPKVVIREHTGRGYWRQGHWVKW
jgi:hypothetical protein